MQRPDLARSLDPLVEPAGVGYAGGFGARWVAAAALFAELRRELAAVPPEETLSRLTQLAVAKVPGAHAASIVTVRDGTFRTEVATHDRAGAADEVQCRAGTGPGPDAIRGDTVQNAAELFRDPRWPGLGEQIRSDCGYSGMLSFPLSADEAAGGLNLYAELPHAFDEPALETGWLLAIHGGIALTAAATRQQLHNLERALESSRDIGIAIGVLMNKHRVTREQAFDVLRIASQRLNRKIKDLARYVVDTGTLPEQPGFG